MSAEVAYVVAAVVNTAVAVGVIVAMWLYRRDRNREALETRMIAVLVLVAWGRFIVGVPTARPETSAAVAAGLTALSIYLLRPPQVRHLTPWLPRCLRTTKEGTL